ncbi:MAG: hypothetical protein AAF664_01005 [Planctomycetota bacterium]
MEVSPDIENNRSSRVYRHNPTRRFDHSGGSHEENFVDADDSGGFTGDTP